MSMFYPPDIEPIFWQRVWFVFILLLGLIHNFKIFGLSKLGMMKWSLKMMRSAVAESLLLVLMTQVDTGHFSLRKTPRPGLMPHPLAPVQKRTCDWSVSIILSSDWSRREPSWEASLQSPGARGQCPENRTIRIEKSASWSFWNINRKLPLIFS